VLQDPCLSCRPGYAAADGVVRPRQRPTPCNLPLRGQEYPNTFSAPTSGAYSCPAWKSGLAIAVPIQMQKTNITSWLR
jgi:hypothetical protein